MKTIRIVFYLAKFDLAGVLAGRSKPHIIDDLISAWTGLWNWGTPAVSHVEIWLEANRTGAAYDGICYTSTMRAKYNGVVQRPASEVLKHRERWLYLQIEMGDIEYHVLERWMAGEIKDNRGYDIGTLAKFFLPFAKWRSSKPDKYICSEFVQYALFVVRVFSCAYLWSPRRLWKKLVKTRALRTYRVIDDLIVRDSTGRKLKIKR